MEKKLNQLELKKDQLTLKISNLEEEYFRTSSPYVNFLLIEGNLIAGFNFTIRWKLPTSFSPFT